MKRHLPFCIRIFLEVYEMGEVYDVPAATLKRYPDYFKKKLGRPPNKQTTTGENK